MSILDLISKETGVPVEQLLQIVLTADHRYKAYPLSKRSGGVRVIHHPARELKFLQRWLVSNVFSHAEVHPAATAYRTGASVLKNAAVHSGSRFFLKIDFENFFPSIRVSDVIALLQKLRPSLPFELDASDVSLVGRIATRQGQLTIGAPCSPVISNAVMYLFDHEMSSLAVRFDCRYTRYADDITFSTRRPSVLRNLLAEVRTYLAQVTAPSLRINENKLSFNSKKRRVLITGLTINSQNEISLGRRTKRKIKSLVHQFSLGNLDPRNTSYLSGYLSYAHGVEPDFVRSLERKYGEQLLAQLRDAPIITRKVYSLAAPIGGLTI
jgi:RNA-directed DNA polymerase